MVLEEDWPIEKKRRLIRKAIELYRIRGTVKGIKLFIALFTGHEPDIKENIWPFRGWRVLSRSALGPRLTLFRVWVTTCSSLRNDLFLARLSANLQSPRRR